MIVTNLDVYHKAHILTLKVYDVTSKFPKDEIYGLVSQLRRAAVSINSNLVEGAARVGKSEFKHFAGISRGSAAELRYQLLLAKDLGFLQECDYNCIDALNLEVLKMLSALITNS